jgi:hypothetical protein
LQPDDEAMARLRKDTFVAIPYEAMRKHGAYSPMAAYLCRDHEGRERLLAIYGGHAGCYLARVPDDV